MNSVVLNIMVTDLIESHLYVLRKASSRNNGNRGKGNSRKVRCKQTKEIFESATRASLEMGMHHNAVSSSICGGHRCGGYYWEYVD